MNELLSKLSSYHVFNYLFPGVTFVVILSYLTKFNLIQENIIIGAFFYYFIGLVISRIGSLIVEPCLKKISFVKFAEYDCFIRASKKDNKIETLSEINNMYRTICAVLIIAILTVGFEKATNYFSLSPKATGLAVLVFLLILFLFAYRKQTSYVRKRVIENDK